MWAYCEAFVADLRSVNYLNQHPGWTVHTWPTSLVCLFSMSLVLIVIWNKYSFSIAVCFPDQMIEESCNEAVQFVRSLFNTEIWPSGVWLQNSSHRCCPSSFCIYSRSASFATDIYQSVCWLTAKLVTFETAEEFNRGSHHVVYVKTKNEYDESQCAQ